MNTAKDIHLIECITNLTELLQTMAIQIEEYNGQTCTFQKLCKQYNCCEIQTWFSLVKSQK